MSGGPSKDDSSQRSLSGDLECNIKVLGAVDRHLAVEARRWSTVNGEHALCPLRRRIEDLWASWPP